MVALSVTEGVDKPLKYPVMFRAADLMVVTKLDLLDAVGDLALAGAPLSGRFIAHRSGHSLNNRLLRALFADTSAWREADAAPPVAAAA